MPWIPPFGGSGLLPPFVGIDPANSAASSPYRVSVVDVVNRFSTSVERRMILSGLLQFRADLQDFGLISGFQWLDGSFVENIDKVRPPRDIDIVTFFRRPASLQNSPALGAAINLKQHLFNPALAKPKYHCDPYFVDLNMDSEQVVRQTKYWFGLFSHTRSGQEWKGMLEIPLATLADDATAAKLLTLVGTP
jgi:hypothetical protein